MSELAIVTPQAVLAEKVEWSQTMAGSSLLPKQYQKNPANLFFAVEYADALGVDRIHAITSIHVIDGKPSASADLIAATVRRAGHKLRVVGDDTYAEATLIRADDPDFTYAARWDLDKARLANLAGKGVWKNYPGAMLRSRAITEVARMGASDALFGVAYTPEELGADVDASGSPRRSQPTDSLPTRGSAADRMSAALAPQPSGPEADPGDLAPVEPIETSGPDVPPLDPRSSLGKAMFAAINNAGIPEADRIAFCAETIGRDISSSKQMTEDDARKVLDHLPAQGELVPDQPAGESA